MKLFFLLLQVFVFIGCTSPAKETLAEPPAIIPQPRQLEVKPGSYLLESPVGISAGPGTGKVSIFLIEFLNANNIASSTAEQHAEIRLVISKEAETDPEGYRLNIDEQGVSVTASDEKGLFYGIQSLMQVIASGKKLPYMNIEDQPRFAYRGMHLDVGRHMFPVPFIKKYIDLMSHFKFNTFHWHLTEDQGWRIEIKKYPELQTKAAFRNETVVGYATTRTRAQATYDGKPYGGYYTQDEVREVVAYAADRHITVVPEVELPGHSQAALTAYPHLGCIGGPYETARSWGVFTDIYCAGKESTFEFLEDVFDEVLPLFPGKYVHIGGDEAPKDNWKKCTHCQQRIKNEGLADEHELQSYFVQRMDKYLNAQGKTIIGWDEILEGGLAPNAVVMSWRGEEGGIAAAQQNHQVIMTPVGWCYFDYYQASPENEPLAINQVTTVEKVYSYEPVPAELSEAQAQLVLGAQCNLWSEYVKSGDHAEYMMYPRALAMAEVLWSLKESKDYAHFADRVARIRPLLDQWEINYATHIFKSN